MLPFEHFIGVVIVGKGFRYKNQENWRFLKFLDDMQVVPSPRRFDNPRIWRTVVGTLRYSLPYFGMPDRVGGLVCPTTVLSAVGPGAIHKLDAVP